MSAADTSRPSRRSPIRRWLRSDLAVDRGTGSGLLIAIIAIVTLLGALAIAAERAVAGLAERWNAGLAGAITIELPPGDGRRDEAVLALVRRTDGVQAARVLPREDIARLLDPWIGPAARSRDIPLPTLVDVTLDAGRMLDVRALEDRLAGVAPGARVDDHAALQTGAARIGLLALAAALGLLVLVGVIAAGAVVFATHAAIAIHRDAIELLHHIGASDAYVARQFAVHAAAVGALGGLIGLFAAMFVLLVADRALPATAVFGALPPAATIQNLTCFLLLPPAAGVLALATAWRTVQGALLRLT